MAMTLPLLLSSLRQCRTELELAKHANRRATARLKAAMAAYNWCAWAFAGMKQRGGSCNIASLAKRARAMVPAGTAPWPRETAMTMAGATMGANVEDTVIIDLKKARARESKAGGHANQTDAQYAAKNKELQCHGKVEEQCHARAERGNGCRAMQVHEKEE